jgi:hypothetical protein
MTIARRLFLGALALAPAALAGCAGGKGARGRGEAAGAGLPPAAAGPPDPVLAPVRNFPLSADAAPAFVFRAAAARPGER